jgi:hypothetical protein
MAVQRMSVKPAVAPEGVHPTLVASNTTYAFLSEVHQFRTVVVDPTISDADKRNAYVLIVSHAAALDPRDVGFERVGVALKEALSMWLDCRPGSGH